MVNQHVMHVRQGMEAGGVTGRLNETLSYFKYTFFFMQSNINVPQEDTINWNNVIQQ